jgi:ZIP family zinc transporter
VSTAQIVLLGGIAGGTIFLGLPLGRVDNPSPQLKAALAAFATGVLVFLLVDVLGHGVAPVKEAAEEHSWSKFAGYGLLFAVGAGVGLLSLVFYDQWLSRERRRSMLGPGAASAVEFEPNWVAGMSPGRWLALLIATGIGLHNFSEGLAIGQAGATGEIGLALVLIIGFGLHNSTEGFGIVAPLSGERPSWRFLALLGLIGGGPTFLGTIVGQAWTSTALSVVFLALAGGSILYVVMQLVSVTQRLGFKLLCSSAILAGLLLGFATEMILEAAGV